MKIDLFINIMSCVLKFAQEKRIYFRPLHGLSQTNGV